MDHEKLGLFSSFLKHAYEETLQVDVVRVKRDKMSMRLEILKNACRDKEYDKANYVLLDICGMVLNDPCFDEYNMKPVEVDMVVFSSAILSITVRHYDRVEHIMTNLIMKYRNPFFYYILGVSYFYELSFMKAQRQFDVVMELLAENKNLKFPWPDTDVMIIRIGADKIREYAIAFLKAISMIKQIKNVHSLTLMERVEALGISKSQHHIAFNANIGIGHVIKYKIYPFVEAILDEVIKFDKSKLPVEFRKVLVDINESSVNKTQEIPKKVRQPNTDCECTHRLKTIVPVQLETKQPKPATPTAPSVDKDISKKDELIQVQPATKCKLVQTVPKGVQQQTQTTEDLTGISDKYNAETEHKTVLGLKAKLQQMSIKLKEAEAKLTKNKNDTAINDKNKLITEQQDIIADLRSKLNQQTMQQKDLGTKLNKMSNKVSELTKTNKTMLAESEKYKETITQLRTYNQMLEKSAKQVDKKQDELNSIEKNLFDNYRKASGVQIKFYERFHKRCESMLYVLNNVCNNLTEFTVPTKSECVQSINQWFTAMVSCNNVIQTSQNLYHKHNNFISHVSLAEVAKMPPMMPIEEPRDILLEVIPILIYTIQDFEKISQDNHNKPKVDDGGNDRGNNEASSIFGGKTDYRKKSNFIHKNDEPISSKENACSPFDKPSKLKFNSKSENSPQKSSETNTKNSRSLMTYLKQNIPYRSETDIVSALNICRKNNNGSLSGLAVQYILYNVLEILESPGMAWSAVKDDLDELDDNKDVCPICIEAVSNETKTTLTCRHVYHSACIREWLAVNRVCAVCRNYTVLDEEFPPLKHPVCS